MSDGNSLQQIRAQLQDLLQAAEAGTIIPVRLPGQISEIIQLVDLAEAEAKEAAASSAMPADMEDYMKDEAYFIGHAVHELRTPMTSIRGYSDMMGAMGELTDMQQQFLETIRTNSKRMESLLADVSYMNKIRKDTLAVAEKMDMFKNIAMRLEKDMQPLAEELDCQLELDIPQGLPLLNIDGELLSVALEKLLENSIRYTVHGEGKVSVKAEADGQELVVTITDNGIGMTPEEQAELGTIYFRSDNDIVREYKGSGLGIPIAFGLMDKLGVSYDYTSEAGKGTIFTIRIKGMT